MQHHVNSIPMLPAFLGVPFGPKRFTSFSDVNVPRMSIAPRLIQFVGASDFEIRRYIGSLGFKTIVEWEYYEKDVNPLAPTRTVQSGGEQVRLYDARCIANNPVLYNTRVLLKEFLPTGMELGVNEANAYQRLYESKGESQIDPNEVPVATLFGSFTADESFNSLSFAANWASRFPQSPRPPAPGSPFLVFRWEGNQTAARLPVAFARGDSPGGRFLDRFLWPKSAARKHGLFLKVFMKKSLLALLYLHSAGLVHRSVSSSSLLLNTLEQRLVNDLEVKLSDLGFSKAVSDLLSGSDMEKAQKAGAIAPNDIAAYFYSEDIYSLGCTFCEVIFDSLAMLGSEQVSPDAGQGRLRTLFEDTFALDIDQFRDYCAAEEAWLPTINFLDGQDRAGWTLLRDMLSARKYFKTVTVQALLGSPFLNEVK